MKYFTLILSIAMILFSCKSQEKKMTTANEINVEHALQNLIHLKTSDFGKTIRYVPLETTDKSLVGNNPIIKVLNNYIVVENRQQRNCLLFDKKDGRFIAEIGRFGQGPREFSDNFSWTDDKEEFLYFQRQPDQLLRFDMQGNYDGYIQLMASFYLIMEEEIIGYYSAGFMESAPFVLGFFNAEGDLQDSIPHILSPTNISHGEIITMSVYTRYDRAGTLSNSSGLIFMDVKNDQSLVLSINAPRIWKNESNIRFKENFVDTIYTVSGTTLIPSFVFNTGRFHWAANEMTDKRNSDRRLYISDVKENNHFIFFQCIRGLFADEPILYHGLYNKQMGVTKLGKHSDEIKDDITHFMPFVPLGVGTFGEFFGFVQAYQALEWLENNPEARHNDKLSFLNGLDEDANPIIVLIE